MAETERITILRVDTGVAVSSIQDLRDNIKTLKSDLATLEVGSEEYNKTLAQLTTNQNALKDAMHLTDTEGKTAEQVMDGISKSASGVGTSYNALARQMAKLRDEWKSTEDVARRDELSKQINKLNDQLKGMDYSTGNFQRNVGNYGNALQSLSSGFAATAGGARGAIGPINSMTLGMKALSTTPVIAILGLLASAIAKVTEGLKSSEEGTRALTASFSSFQGIGDLFKNLMQTLGQAVAWVADKINNLAVKIFPKLAGAQEKRAALTKDEIRLTDLQREATMKNADAELAVSKLRAKAAQTDKYNAEQRIKFLEEANSKELAISQRNKEIAELEYSIAKQKSALAKNSKEENDALAAAYAKVQKAEQEYFDKSRRLNSQLASARKELAGETQALIDIEDKWLEKMDTGIAAQMEQNKLQDAFSAEIDGWVSAEEEAIAAVVDAAIEDVRRSWAEAEEEAKAKQAAIKAGVAATSSILGSLADIYEATTADEQKAAEDTKGIRIAAAIIDTISGAVSAYMSAQKLTPPFGQIVGATNAAAVTATGLAQVAKIRSTNASGKGISAAASVASFRAPSLGTSIPATTIVRGAADEQTLNDLTQRGTKVYILQSDIEAAGAASKARVSEASFS